MMLCLLLATAKRIYVAPWGSTAENYSILFCELDCSTTHAQCYSPVAGTHLYPHIPFLWMVRRLPCCLMQHSSGRRKRRRCRLCHVMSISYCLSPLPRLSASCLIMWIWWLILRNGAKAWWERVSKTNKQVIFLMFATPFVCCGPEDH